MLTRRNIKSAVLVRKELPVSNIPVDIWDMKQSCSFLVIYKAGYLFVGINTRGG